MIVALELGCTEHTLQLEDPSCDKPSKSKHTEIWWSGSYPRKQQILSKSVSKNLPTLTASDPWGPWPCGGRGCDVHGCFSQCTTGSSPRAEALLASNACQKEAPAQLLSCIHPQPSFCPAFQHLCICKSLCGL